MVTPALCLFPCLVHITWEGLLHVQVRIPSFSGGACYTCRSRSHHYQEMGACYTCRSGSHHSQGELVTGANPDPIILRGACYTCKSGSRYSQREFVTCADPDPIILRKWERPQIPNKQLGSKPTALLYSGPRGSLHMVSSLELPTSLSLYVMLHLEKRSN